MLRRFREEEEKTRDARKNLLIWIAILSSNDSNGFISFKIIKAAVLNTVTGVAQLCNSLSLSHSDRRISSNKLFHLYTYFHTAMRSIIIGQACGCCAVLKL